MYYKFDDFRPQIGEETHVFKSEEALRKFARQMVYDGAKMGEMKFWEIEGNITKLDGSIDGTVVMVRSVREISLSY
ncbi:MAG: hypothetical protein R2728_05190 [Chitinophagales bacterium]